MRSEGGAVRKSPLPFPISIFAVAISEARAGEPSRAVSGRSGMLGVSRR